MSKESTRNVGAKSAGSRRGFRYTRPTPGRRSNGPSTRNAPRIPWSIRKRYAKRTSASKHSTPASASRARIGGTSPGRSTSTRSTGSPENVRSADSAARAAGATRWSASRSAARTKK